jgi:hypothetical protein
MTMDSINNNHAVFCGASNAGNYPSYSYYDIQSAAVQGGEHNFHRFVERAMMWLNNYSAYTS